MSLFKELEDIYTRLNITEPKTWQQIKAEFDADNPRQVVADPEIQRTIDHGREAEKLNYATAKMRNVISSLDQE